MAAAAVLVSSLFIDTSGPLINLSLSATARPDFLGMLTGWALGTLKLLVRLAVIIIAIISLLEVFKNLGWIKALVRPLSRRSSG